MNTVDFIIASSAFLNNSLNLVRFNEATDLAVSPFEEFLLFAFGKETRQELKTSLESGLEKVKSHLFVTETVDNIQLDLDELLGNLFALVNSQAYQIASNYKL